MNTRYLLDVGPLAGRLVLTVSRTALVGVTLEPGDGADAAPLAGELPDWLNLIREQLLRWGRGEPADFSGVPVELPPGPEWLRAMLTALRRVPQGSTITYGELAAAAGYPGGARLAGQAMSRNPVPVIIPCHRVLARDRRPGGFSGGRGLSTKLRLLHLEGVLPDLRGLESPFTSLQEPGVEEIARRHLSAVDPDLARIISKAPRWNPTPRFPGTPLAALCEAVVYQQLSGRVAESIFRKVRPLLLAENNEFAAADRIAGLDPALLRGAGLSNSKAATILALARSLAEPEPGSDFLEAGPWTEVRESLLAIKGIGPWTTDMFGIFHRGEPDILPLGDLGIRRAAASMRGLDRLLTPEELEQLGRRWRPFRTMAAWLLWASEGTVTM